MYYVIYPKLIKMVKKHLPAYSLNKPNGGPQPPPLIVPDDQPVYSSYTGKLINIGPVSFGTMGDAPPGHHNFGDPFHVIVYNPENGSWMMHRPQGFF